MKPCDIFELKIEKTAQDGRGLAKIDDFVVFVKGALEGDTVLAKIYSVHKTYATAEVLELLAPSPDRRFGFCENEEKCGGCAFSHIKYPTQLKIKKQTVTDALFRIGGFDLEKIKISDTIGMDVPERYRNKMVFPVGHNEKGRAVGGFYRERSHEIVPLKECKSGTVASEVALSCVVDFMNKNGITPFNEKTKKGSLRRVFVRTGYHTKELMVVLSSAKKDIKNLEVLVGALASCDFGEYNLKSIILNINKKPNNLVLGDENITLWGDDVIYDTIMGIRFSISPNSFFQVNPVQTEVLYKTALDLAELTPDTTVLDVYCGVGTISLCASKYAKKVVGVEIVHSAILNAIENAKENNLKNAEFICGAAEDIVPRLIKTNEAPDVVILDPPRKGSDEKTLSAVSLAKPERIVYVSCNPATLARDARFLCDNGYALTQAIPVDMFPNTEHVECCVLLCRT